MLTETENSYFTTDIRFDIIISQIIELFVTPLCY